MKSPIKINFGTDGFRGVIGRDFSFEAVSSISVALAEFLKSTTPVSNLHNSIQSVAVGYDTRFLSKEFALAAAESISSRGFKVYLSDNFCPSPALSYFVSKNSCLAGVMITASHNPFSFNGVKFKSPQGGSMLQADVKKVEAIVNSPLNSFNGDDAPKNISESIVKKDFKSEYIEHVINFLEFGDIKRIPLKDEFEVVFDPMFGAGIGYLTTVLKGFSIKHRVINGHINPIFPGINPEPIDVNLSKLKSLVKTIGKQNKFAVGFATDGDADRIGAVDYMGNFVDSHKIFAIILNFLLQEGYSGNVVKTVSVSKSIDEICKNRNLKLFEVPIGFKNIAELMLNKENDILMGGEESGGIGITSHIPERDGVLNALLLLKIMIVRGKNLNELLFEIFGKAYPFVYERIDLHLSADKKNVLVERLKSRTFSLPNAKNIISENFIDGFKFVYADGSWLLIRPSGTEPLLRIYAESNAKNAVEELIGKTKEEIWRLP